MSENTRLTYGPSNIDSFLTSSLSAIRGKRARDTVFNEIPAFAWMEKKKKTKVTGGASLLVPIMSGGNSTAMFYRGYQQLDVTPQEGFTMAQYTWRNGSVSVSISGPEERANKGEHVIIKLLNAKKDQALKALRNKLSQKLWSTTQNADELQALPILVDTTSTVADISRSANSWWQAQQTTSGVASARLLADMKTMYNNIRRQSTEGSAPDLIITTQTVYEAYEGLAQPQQRLEDTKMADLGFENLRFKTSQMFFDENCPSGQMYILHTDALELVVNSEADFDTTEFVKPANQDARTAQILVQLALVTDNPRRLGKLVSIS